MTASASDPRVREALSWLESKGSPRRREEMATRYGIHAKKAWGVPMAAMQQLGKKLGRDHALAAALWATGWYEARIVACYIDEPERGTPAQMDRWAKDFDNWGIVDTVCFVLFDRTPHAWAKARAWCARREEFVRRAGFVLVACLGLHDKASGDAPFERSLDWIEKGAADERNFVKKGVSWALRVVGRRSTGLLAPAAALAERLAASKDPAARWVGKDALRDFAKAGARARSKAKAGAGAKAKPGAKAGPTTKKTWPASDARAGR